ncbi:MAG: DUF2281 domain-containing protein, partial [Anaerolineae bacterium]|nr:DUF2281 domain-containing protein [Anaerolineae bacterium]
MGISQAAAVKQHIYQVLNELPPSGRDELLQFLDYLRYKHKAEQGRKSVALKGLWADIPFDVTDQDIRRLRQRVSAQLLRKV